VARPRLVAELESAPVAFVVAGSGYGKSLLASELARSLGIARASIVLGAGDEDPPALVARLTAALARARLADLAASVRAERADPVAAVDALADALARERDPVLLALDDAHHAAQASAELVGRLARQLPAHHRLLVLARHLTPQLEPPVQHADRRLLAAELAFTTSEVSDLFARGFGIDLTAADAEALRRATAGWAAALVLAADTLARSEDRALELQALVDRRRPLRYLVDRQLAALDATSRSALVRLAHLPLLLPAVAEQVAGDATLLERAAAAGIPLTMRADGWWELPGPVQELIVCMTPLDAAAALSAAPVYARHGELSTAVQLLLAAGEADAAGALVAGLSPQDADELGYLELQTLIDALPAHAVDRHPGLLLHLARTCEPAAQTRLRARTLERVRALARRSDDPLLASAVEAEHARDLVRDDRADEAEALAAAVLDRLGAGEIATRARVLDVLGRVAAWKRDDASLARAERLLQEAHSLCVGVGQRSWASQVVLPLAHGVFYARGDHERALEWIERALHDLPARSRHRGVILSFYGDILIDCGRFADAEPSVEEERRLGELLNDRRISAYAAWTSAKLASQTGDRERTLREVSAVEGYRDDWFDHATGVDFLADAADLLDRVGETELALEYLERARARREEAPLAVAVAEGAVLARSGDPAEAGRELQRVEAMPRLEPRELWRCTLLRAYAALRRGDPAAGALAARAFDQAAALGKPLLPLVRELRVAERLLDLAAASGSVSAAQLRHTSRPLVITTLGQFEVRQAGTLVRLPPGKPEQLVKLLAVSGGRLPTDQAIEALWPEVDPASGRKRLRNALNRLHAVAPDVATREGDVLTLGAVEVDAVAFEHETRQLLERRDAAGHRLALARYRGPLLPDDRYEPWAAAPRERLERLYVALLDAAASAAEAAGEHDEALRYIERALDADPYDEQRYARAAELLLEQGRRAAALRLLDRAAQTLEQLGLSVPAAHRKLAAAAMHGELAPASPAPTGVRRDAV
jgi:ATP/maltotriose-dependent transcriptional regulator MalT